VQRVAPSRRRRRCRRPSTRLHALGNGLSVSLLFSVFYTLRKARDIRRRAEANRNIHVLDIPKALPQKHWPPFAMLLLSLWTTWQLQIFMKTYRSICNCRIIVPSANAEVFAWQAKLQEER